ncbi:MAG: NAD(P)H-dependent oxidoreductase [Acidobacteriota bacterium]|nr:NAD(P)H-dependent oxidoreductase [Acidobacteriota bacterium]
MRILAISGSLRNGSSSATLLRAAAMIAPSGVEIVAYDGIGELPHFNPDLDDGTPPEIVAKFRGEVAAADALMISSPEYAHGVPGTLKNALDWLVGGAEINGKPVALVNASARATYAQAALQETLSVMGARVIASVISLDGRKNLDARAMMDDPEISSALRSVIEDLR